MKLMMPIVILATILAGLAQGGEEIADSQIGLSRTSVFDTPEPAPYDYDGTAPAIPAMAPSDVPVIPHDTRDFEKITIGRNRCLRCHLLPELIGKPLPEDEATPIPASHYEGDPVANPEAQIAGERWVCTQCHVSQSNSEELVRNTAVE